MVLWVYSAIVTVPNPLVEKTNVFWSSQIFTFPLRTVKASCYSESYKFFLLPKPTQLSNWPTVISICSAISLTFYHALICLRKPYVLWARHSMHRRIHANYTHLLACSTVPEKFAQTSQTESHLNLRIITFFVILIFLSLTPLSLHLCLFVSLHTHVIVFLLQPSFSPSGDSE